MGRMRVFTWEGLGPFILTNQVRFTPLVPVPRESPAVKWLHLLTLLTQTRQKLGAPIATRTSPQLVDVLMAGPAGARLPRGRLDRIRLERFDRDPAHRERDRQRSRAKQRHDPERARAERAVKWAGC